MRLKPTLSIVCALWLASASGAFGGAAPASAATVPGVETVTRRLLERLELDIADPTKDALSAAARGDFGLIVTAFGRGGGGRAPGVVCHTPYGYPAAVRGSMRWGDSLTAENSRRISQYEAYAATYNRLIVDHPRFQYADLCAPQAIDAPAVGSVGGLHAIGAPARRLNRPPLTLHEAARRSDLEQVRALLAEHPVDGLDGFNMTPMAWAVAHDRADVVELLLSAGASSMGPPTGGHDVTPVLAAISQRRLSLLRRLQPPQPYPERYVEAAIRTNDAAIVREVLTAPHQPLRPTMIFRGVTPSAEVASHLIDSGGKPAIDAVLLEGAGKGRPDLVRLALAKGADPNLADYSGETPLLAALSGYDFDPMPVVEALIAAGADVNQRVRPGAGYDTPFWLAYQRASYSEKRIDLLRRMIAAGGDAGVPIRLGTPSVWMVIFAPRLDLTEIAAPSLDLLRLLVGAGMDLNAMHAGKCVLDAVEALTSRGGELAHTLRSLGARRRSVNGRCTA